MSRRIQIISMSLIYIFAGIYHFINPVFYTSIIPDYFEEKQFLIALSGLIEILLAIFLLFKETRKFASILIILMLLVFLFAIHFPMVVDYYDTQNRYLWLSIIRIPIQLLLILWAFRISRFKVETRFN